MCRLSIEELRTIIKNKIQTKDDVDIYLQTIILTFVKNKDIEEFKRSLSIIADKLDIE